MKLSLKGWYSRSILALIDALLLNLANTMAFWLRFHNWPPLYNWQAYLKILPWEVASLIGVFYFYGLYSHTNRTSAEVRSATATGVIVNGFLTTAFSFLIVDIGMPRSVFLISTFLQIPLFIVWRLGYRSYMLRTAPSVTVLALGRPDEWQTLTVRAGQFLPRIAMRFAEPDASIDDGLFDDIGAVVMGSVPKPLREQYFIACVARNVPCLWHPDTYDLLVSGAELTTLGETPMFSLASVRVRHGTAVMKRLADIVVAVVGLGIGFPVLALIGLAILIDSGLPILYRQERVTAGGRVFQLIKFRTMVPDAEQHTGPVLASVGDPRITRLGHLLRTTHLDELPQLWNILAGDMSLVGPRPERPVFVDEFKQHIPHYDLRHITTPGLTGLAQVSGSYASSPEDKATYDVHYAKSWSWLKDMAIIVRTIFQFMSRQDPR